MTIMFAHLGIKARSSLFLTKISQGDIMKNRKFVVRNTEQEGDPIIHEGLAPFFVDDTELIPDGYHLDIIQNAPDLKTIYVKAA